MRIVLHDLLLMQLSISDTKLDSNFNNILFPVYKQQLYTIQFFFKLMKTEAKERTINNFEAVPVLHIVP